jgi:type IV pilus assembly protein PilV
MKPRGYTIVEVMMALAVMAVGATGVIAMQKATLVGNTRARNLSTASTIASAWLDRVKLDALSWRKLDTGGTTISKTKWLTKVGEDFPQQSGDEGKWFRPDIDSVAGYSPMADVRGFDITDTNKTSEAAYCTHLRLTQLLPNMIRAEVRVFWLRNHGTSVSNKYAGTLNGKQLCDGDQGYVTDVGTATSRYHFVYLSSAVMQAQVNP